MDWVKWVVPLIGLLVWVISNVIKQQEQIREQNPVPPPRPQEPVPRSQEEMERFLEEVRRRKQQQAQQPTQKPAPPPPVPAARPSPPPAQAQAQAKEYKPIDQRPELRPAGKQANKIRESEHPRPRPRQGHEPVPMQAEVLEAQPVPAPVNQAPQVIRKSNSPTANLLMKMLEDSESTKAALVLAEVLGPPLSRRKPGSSR